MARTKKYTEELGEWMNGLRDYLGLDPLHKPHAIPREIRSRQLDVLRFGATRPDPWHPSRTPMRNSGS